MNFMALVVIWDFGKFFYDAFNSKKEWKEILTEEAYEHMLVIQTTTSGNARETTEESKNSIEYQLETHEKRWFRDRKKFRIPEHIRIDFWKDRSWKNRFFFVIFKVIRSFYVCFWYYFLPFSIIIGSYLVPYVAKKHIGDEPET